MRSARRLRAAPPAVRAAYVGERAGGAVTGRASFAAAVALLMVAGAAPAAAEPGQGQDDSALSVEVLTFGPGDHPFTRFGHDAIRIVDAQAHTDVVYNFGTFSIAAPHLIRDFLNARLRYWLSRGRASFTLADYQRENRTIVSQRLSLAPAQRRELARRLAENALPANRDYRYDYFRDNCSTRVRDALDGVLGGRLRAVALQPGSMTLRAHALRLAADAPSLYLALLIVLGPAADTPIDRWGEAFLPGMLQATLRDVRLDGPDRPLVADERVLFVARRAPPRAAPPSWGPGFLGVGVAIGLTLFGLARSGRRWLIARIAWGAIVALLGLVCGGIGSFLLWAWIFTPHGVVYRNQNILLFAPFALVLLVLGPAVAAGSQRAMQALGWIARAGLGTTIVACVLKLPGLPHQQNGALILALLPFWIGLTGAARAFSLGGRPREATAAT